MTAWRHTLTALGLALLTSGTALADQPLRAEVITVEERPLVQRQRVIGTIEPRASYTAAFRGNGRIVEMLADTGDIVEEGAVLARLDDVQARLVEAAATAALAATGASLEQARTERNRTAERLDRGVGTRAQMDEAEEALLAAEAATRQAQTRLEIARQGLEDAVIRAAEEAVVIARSADVGEVVGPSRPVFTLARANEREALFLLPDRAGLDQFLGREVDLRPQDGGPSFAARVAEISPILGPSGTVAVRARIAMSAEVPPLGAIVEASLEIEGPPRFEVPWTALTATASGPAVWIVQPGGDTAHLRPVTVERYRDTEVVLSAGLEPGMRVVGAGSQGLYEGRVVIAITPPGDRP